VENFDGRFMFEQLHASLAQLEEKAGDPAAAIFHWEQAKLASPSPGSLQSHIDELKQKLAAQPSN
jgi:hypothetical protein